MIKTHWAPQLVGRAAWVELFLRFPSCCLRVAFVLPSCCLRVAFVGNLNVSTNSQPMKASEGALESSYRAVSGLDAGWVRGVGLVEQWRHHVAPVVECLRAIGDQWLP